MTRRTLVLRTLAYYLVGMSNHAGAASGAGARTSVLQGVDGLDRPLSYTESKIPLGELVRRVAADTGVELAAAPEVADEPVAVVVNEVPARELLEQLADLLGYQWSRRGGSRAGRYEIWQDLASHRREASLREAMRADVQRRFMSEVRRYAEVASMPTDRPEAITGGADDRDGGSLGSTDGQRPGPGAPARDEDREWRRRVASQLWSPVNRALARVAGILSPEQWVSLQAGQVLVFSTMPRAGELGLPGDIARSLRQAQPSLFPPWSRPSPADGAAGDHWLAAEQDARRVWSEATGFEVRLSIETNRLPGWGSLALRLTAGAIGGDGSSPGFVPGFGGDTNIVIGASPLYPQTPAPALSPAREARLERDPVVGASKRFAAPTARGASGPGNHGPAIDPRDPLPALAQTYGVDIISDAYWGAYPTLRASDVAAGRPVSLFALLDHIASHDWDHRGRLVRLRSRTWFLDRPREIPLRMARRWEAVSHIQGALPLEEYARMATTLTELQLEGLAAVRSGPGLRSDLVGLSSVYAARHALRLYASLAPAQQLALWQGADIPVARMTTAQQELYLRSLEDGARALRLPMGGAMLLPGRFSMRPRPYTVVRQAGGITFEPEAPTQAGAPGAQRPAGAPVGAPGPHPVPAGDAVHRYTVTQISFHFENEAGMRIAVAPLTVADDRPPPRAGG